MGQQWSCSYCNRPCTIGESDIRIMSGEVWINAEYGRNKSITTIIVCPNPTCKKQTISLRIIEMEDRAGLWVDGSQLSFWSLLPESEAKPYPDYIPLQLRNDYTEACLIKDKSPKASATLSRRCLQGMIRDFWDIKERTLFLETTKLQDKVDEITWQAIDSVRQVGNIGAHMGGDINLIVDIEPEEAAILIGLIETLFQEWYVAKHDRGIQMQKIIRLAVDKKSSSSAQTPTSEQDFNDNLGNMV